MTPRLRSLGGRDIVLALGRFGFTLARTRGSHATMVRTSSTGDHQVITIPLHKELAPGTLGAIYRQALKFVPAEELRPQFFHD